MGRKLGFPNNRLCALLAVACCFPGAALGQLEIGGNSISTPIGAGVVSPSQTNVDLGSIHAPSYGYTNQLESGSVPSTELNSGLNPSAVPFGTNENRYLNQSLLGGNSTNSEWPSVDHSDDLISVTRTNPSWKEASYASRTSTGWFDEFSGILAMDGSKQPQDFGVNANAGLQASINWGLPVLRSYGIGMQLGTNITQTQNAVRVYELLGETKSRTQSYTTVGAFQRLDSGFAWGAVYDFLYEDSYDNFNLGQWRFRAAYDLNECNQFGVTAHLRSQSDNGVWGAATPVTLRPINQGSVYWRKFWGTRAQTTGWIGIADRHSEDNLVTGPSPAKRDSFLYGADIFMPLNHSFAIYGETNIITPFDTGTVDAFLGLQWFPGGKAFQARRGKYAPLLQTASPVSFSTDLVQ